MNYLDLRKPKCLVWEVNQGKGHLCMKDNILTFDMQNKFEDNKEAIRINKSKKDGQQNSEKKWTNNDLQKSKLKTTKQVSPFKYY